MQWCFLSCYSTIYVSPILALPFCSASRPPRFRSKVESNPYCPWRQKKPSHSRWWWSTSTLVVSFQASHKMSEDVTRCHKMSEKLRTNHKIWQEPFFVAPAWGKSRVGYQMRQGNQGNRRSWCCIGLRWCSPAVKGDAHNMVVQCRSMYDIYSILMYPIRYYSTT